MQANLPNLLIPNRFCVWRISASRVDLLHRLAYYANGMSIALWGVREIRRTAMLRVTVVESSRIAVTLRAEGRLTGPWVEELRTACDVHSSPDEVQLYLELEDISFADVAGVELLKELRNRGVSLVRTTPFLAEQLKEGTS
jgi:hypothetical protein